MMFYIFYGNIGHVTSMNVLYSTCIKYVNSFIFYSIPFYQVCCTLFSVVETHQVTPGDPRQDYNVPTSAETRYNDIWYL